MKFFCVVCTFLLCAVAINGQQGSGTSVSQTKSGAAVDEVVVESSLYIKKKPQIRRTRNVSGLILLEPNGIRVKRQSRSRRRPPQAGSSQSAANAAANNQFFGKQGFGASAAEAQAQGFQAQGPLGGFGASAAGTQTQSFTAGRTGIQGAAGASMSQVYHLPNGKTINVALSEGFSAGPNGLSGSNANGVTIS